MSSTKAITELIDALVKALEPKLEELVETMLKGFLPKARQSLPSESLKVVEQTKSAEMCRVANPPL